ncbi:MAG: 4Fe-4S dicluster domain-containing protein [Deltaproteobacteria bacterium]|nr:4Fe-4S dicluster domain-containing protein [Deltaproteobacteria bacterium]
MKGKRITKKDLLDALKKFLKDELALLIAFERDNKAFKIRAYKKDVPDICLFNPVYEANTAIYLRRIFSEDFKILCIFRPCEARAYVELTKLTQVESRSVICGSVDCFGTVSSKLDNIVFPENPQDLKSFLENSKNLRYACMTCRLKNGVFGDFGLRIDSDWNLWVIPYTGKANVLYELISSAESDLPREFLENQERNGQVFQSSLDEFKRDFDKCIMCLNCRDICPVCYCVDCVFNNDEYLPKGDALINSILRSNDAQIPKNKEMYHFIRMYHVSQTCVGCGGCEEACPQGIPLTKYYKGISERLSGLFDYVSGRDFEEKIPYTTFREDELPNADD